MKNPNLKGVIPAAVLPMTADFEPDYKAFEKYIHWLIAENAVSIAVNMDTGEGPQLSSSEKRRVIEVAAAAAGGRCGIVSGVMGGTTRDAADAAKSYREAGADGLVVFPNAAFRNEPLDDRIPVDYHKAIADASGLPLILFQLAPIFGGVNFKRATLLKLLEIPEVVAIKEASFDAQYYAYTIDTLGMSDHKVTLLTGNDRLITESFMLGAEGALLGFCAIGCGLVAEMLAKFKQGDWPAAMEMRPKVQGFANVIYKDPMLDYRARCKVALAHIGVLEFSQAYIRPPMLQIGAEELMEIRKALIQAGMLK